MDDPGVFGTIGQLFRMCGAEPASDRRQSPEILCDPAENRQIRAAA